MIPRLRPNIGWNEFKTAVFSLRNDEHIERFELAFAKLMGHQHAIAFPYGRTALAFILEALGLKGREIICPAYTCAIVPHAIVTSGNEPVFVDSRDYDFNMDMDLLPQAVTEKTGALIATSIFGYPVDLDRLDEFRKRYPSIEIIQDCALSFDAPWQGRPVQLEGEAAFYSFSISKIITTVYGGMVTTDRDDLALRLRRLRQEKMVPAGWKKVFFNRLLLVALYPAFTSPVFTLVNTVERSGLINLLLDYKKKDRIEMPADYLMRMSGLEAQVGLAQLDRYPQIISNRRATAEFYDKALADLPGLRRPPLVEGVIYSYYAVRTERPIDLMAAVLKRGVQLGRWVETSIPQMPAYRDRPGNRLPCPVAREIARTEVNLPICLGVKGAAKVARVIREALCR